MNPFDFTGPQFLVFFVCTAALSAAFVMFFAMIAERSKRGPIPDLSPFEVAAITGGAARVVETALAIGVAYGYFEVVEEEIRRTEKRIPIGVFSENEKMMFDGIFETVGETGCGIELLRESGIGLGSFIVDEMTARDLLVNDTKQKLWRAFSAAVVVLVMGLGGFKIYVGLTRGRPVSTLLALTACYPIVMAILIADVHKPHRRTSFGKLVYDHYQDRYAHGINTYEEEDPDEAGFLVATSGLSALAAFAAFATVYTATSASSCSSCSSCGGCSGCGGGCGGCA